MYNREHVCELSSVLFINLELTNEPDHCLGILRQTVQCSGDISLIPDRYFDGIKGPFIDFDQVHTCRNFDRLREWQPKDTMRASFDSFKPNPIARSISKGLIVESDVVGCIVRTMWSETQLERCEIKKVD